MDLIDLFWTDKSATDRLENSVALTMDIQYKVNFHRVNNC